MRDLAGQEKFKTFSASSYRGAMGVMLVCDTTNEQSFNNIKRWIQNIEEVSTIWMLYCGSVLCPC